MIEKIIDWFFEDSERILICPFERTPMLFEWIIPHCWSFTIFLFPRARASRSIPSPPYLSLHWPSINYSNNFHARLPTAHGRPLFGLRGLVKSSLELSLFKGVDSRRQTIAWLLFKESNRVYFSNRRDDDCEFDWFGSEESRIIFGKNNREERIRWN